MKKLLTLLLTFVMAIGLVVLNNNKTKAEENDNPSLFVGYGTVETTKWSVWKDANRTIEVSPLPQGLSIDAKNKTLIMKNFNYDFATTDYCICFSGDATLLVSGSNSIVGKVESDSALLDGYNLTIKSKNNSLKDKLVVTNYGSSSRAFQAENATIEGCYIKTVCPDGVQAFLTNGSFTMKGGYLEATSNNGFCVQWQEGVSITGNSDIVAYGDAGNVIMLGDKQELIDYLNNNVKTEGSLSTTGKPIAEGYWGNNDAAPFEPTYCIGNDDVAKYIHIKTTAPTPTPEPQPKDESCEKVIGPTWHWNNDKGICEEYATVGTYTR